MLSSSQFQAIEIKSHTEVQITIFLGLNHPLL